MSGDRKSDDQDVKEAIGSLHSGLVGVLTAGVVIARYLWNLQMRGVKTVGIMPVFVRFPWLFVVLGVLLLAFVYPIGVAFTLTALAAGMGGDSPSASSEFLVNVKGDRDQH